MNANEVKDFPDTPWGRSAREAFERLKSMPDIPAHLHDELKLSFWRAIFAQMLASWLDKFRVPGMTIADLKLARQAFFAYWNKRVGVSISSLGHGLDESY
jgi:hypothetical protein